MIRSDISAMRMMHYGPVVRAISGWVQIRRISALRWSGKIRAIGQRGHAVLRIPDAKWLVACTPHGEAGGLSIAAGTAAWMMASICGLRRCAGGLSFS